MLRTALYTFVESLDVKLDSNDQKLLTQEIICYTLGITKSWDLRRTAQTLDILVPVTKFKATFLDTSPYVLSSIWRSFLSYCKTDDVDAASCTFGATVQDLLYIRATLPQKVVDKYLGDMEGYEVTKPKVDPVALAKDITPTIKYIVRSQLTFVVQYDSQYEFDDMVSHLLSFALQTLAMYDYIEDKLHLRNTIVKSVRTEVQRIISSHTDENKSPRLIKVSDAEYDDRGRMIKHPEFRVTTLDLDAPVGEDNATFGGLVQDKKFKQPDDSLGSKDFFTKLFEDLTPAKKAVVEILMGKPHKKFYAWLNQVHSLNTSNLHLVSKKKFFLVACEYFRVNASEFKQVVCESYEILGHKDLVVTYNQFYT